MLTGKFYWIHHHILHIFRILLAYSKRNFKRNVRFCNHLKSSSVSLCLFFFQLKRRCDFLLMETITGTRFTNCYVHIALVWETMVSSGQNFAHSTTTAQIYYLTGSHRSYFQQNTFSEDLNDVLKAFVKSAPGPGIRLIRLFWLINILTAWISGSVDACWLMTYLREG